MSATTYQNKTTIKQWKKDDRPREKMLLHGRQSLSEAELIAILISSGNREVSAVDLAREILSHYKNDLNDLSKRSVHELMQFKGIGEAKAISICAALELGKRRKEFTSDRKAHIHSSIDIYQEFKDLIGDLHHEEFWLLFLSRSNKVIGKEKLSQGGISGTVADIRLMLKKALEYTASGIAAVHNHPSGNLKPSDADIRLTKKLIDACKMMDIQFIDHLIVTDQSYTSFVDNNII